MEFSITGFTKRSFSAVAVSHPGENDIIINAAGYANAKPGAVKNDEEFGMRVELFSEINDLISRYSKGDQQKLYDCYARLDAVLDSYGTDVKASEFMELLQDIVKGIFDIVKFEDLRDYLTSNKNIKFPAELADTYVTADKITPIYMERTYLKREYIDLAAVALGLRCMIPVWGAFLPIAIKEEGPKKKEYVAYKLLETCLLKECPAFDRLETYVRANTTEMEHEMAIIFEFLSSEEIPVFLMALALIRKVSIAPLSAETDKDHLMKVVFNYVCGNNNRLPAAFGGNIRSKIDVEAATDDNSSVWCYYKMKEQISTGDLCIFQLYITDYLEAARAIDQEITDEQTEMCVARAQKLARFDPNDAQVALCIWVMSTVVAGCAIEMFDRNTLFTAMGISQTVLWKWGFHQLAILQTAAPVQMADDEMMTPVPRTKISDENMKQLEYIYPYTMPESKKDSGQSPNVGVRGVEDAANVFFKNEWEPQCPRQLAAKYERSDVTRRLQVSSDFRDELAELFIKLDGYVRHIPIPVMD